jgi:hypothetical protein
MFSVQSALNNNRTGFSVRGPCGGYITRITPAVSQFSGGGSHGNFAEELKCDFKTLCVILGVCNPVRLFSSCVEIRCRRRLVKAGNPSACAMVNWKVCKSAIVLYCLY